MIRLSHCILTLCLTVLLPFYARAEAPVVDNSENFALLEEQQTAQRPSVAHESAEDNFDESQPALAKDDTAPTTNGDNASLINKLQGLQQDLQELRGRLEVQTHELKLLQEQQLAFYKDLDTRLRQAPNQTAQKTTPTALNLGGQEPATPDTSPNESKPATKPGQPLTESNANTNPADEQISYLAAYELIKNKHFDAALIAMQTFTTKYPQGGYTANAHYWLGELYLVKKDYQPAISHFDTVLKQFPSSSKYAASLLKISYALAASNHVNEAKEHLHEIMKKYPDTKTAELARLKLATLGG